MKRKMSVQNQTNSPIARINQASIIFVAVKPQYNGPNPPGSVKLHVIGVAIVSRMDTTEKKTSFNNRLEFSVL